MGNNEELSREEETPMLCDGVGKKGERQKGYVKENSVWKIFKTKGKVLTPFKSVTKFPLT